MEEGNVRGVVFASLARAEDVDVDVVKGWMEGWGGGGR